MLLVLNLAKKESSLAPLFCTFINIVLEKYITTASTGYQQQIRVQNAFKFDIFLSVRDSCTKILRQNDLADDNGVWDNFSYIKKYKNDKAIAVLVYSTLIDLLDIINTQPTVNDASKQFIENYKNDKKMKRG